MIWALGWPSCPRWFSECSIIFAKRWQAGRKGREIYGRLPGYCSWKPSCWMEPLVPQGGHSPARISLQWLFLKCQIVKKCFLCYWHSQQNVAFFFSNCRMSDVFGNNISRKVLLFTSCGRIVTFPALGERHFVHRAAQLFNGKTNNGERIMKCELS